MTNKKEVVIQFVKPCVGAKMSRFGEFRDVFKVSSYSAAFLLLSLVIGGKAMALAQVFKRDFPYVTSESDVQKSLSDMGRRIGLTVRLDPSVSGAVSVDNSAGTVETFLKEVVAQTGSTWWYDGVILYVEPQSGLTTALVISQGLSLSDISEELERLDLLDERFPLASTGDGAVIRVIGPQGYVTQVRSLIETLIATRRARTSTPDEVGLYVPRVIHGRAIN